MLRRLGGATVGALLAGALLAAPALGIPTPTPTPSGASSSSPTGTPSPSGSATEATASPTPSPTDDGLPVLGQAVVSAFGKAQERFPRMVVTVHGLRRVGEATVLYYSVGFLGDAPDPRVMPVTSYGSGPDTYQVLQASPGKTFMDTAAAIDVPRGVSYGALRTTGGRSVSAPPPVDLTDRFRLSDRAVVQWIALAAIPEDVTVVDLVVGSAVIQHVPVANGAMVPVSSKDAPVAGDGWPRVLESELKSGSAEGAVAKLTATITERPPEPSPSPSPSASSSTPPSPTPSATS